MVAQFDLLQEGETKLVEMNLFLSLVWPLMCQGLEVFVFIQERRSLSGVTKFKVGWQGQGGIWLAVYFAEQFRVIVALES